MSSSRPRRASPAAWALEDLAAIAGGHLVPLPRDEDPGLELVSIERDAYARGFEDGQRAGVQVEAARVRAALSAVDDALLSLQGEAEAWVANARENLCALAIGVARQVLMREVTTDASTVLQVAEKALSEVPLEQPVVLRLHPDDLAVLEGLAAGELGPRVAAGRDRSDVQWVADPRVHRGGCLLEARDRIIDGRIDTALERLYRRLGAIDA